MELGNAFTEINDSAEQAARFAMQADEGAGGNVEAEPGDPDYVEALSYGDAAHRRPRDADRPPRHAPARERVDPRRDPLPGVKG
jgi:hypothetical protein